MGKSEDQLKKRTKETPKSPISIFWLGMSKFESPILNLRLLALVQPFLDSSSSADSSLSSSRASLASSPNALNPLPNRQIRIETKRK